MVKAAYVAGRLLALSKLGMEEEAPVTSSGSLTSDSFVAFAESDDTSEMADPNKEVAATPDDDKPTWGNSSSLDAGDVGTRTMEMGLPTPGGV